MENEQAKFDGWAIVDVMGHQRYVGYVTTEAYGGAVLFRIEVPALEERERVTVRAGYLDGVLVPAGTRVKEGAVQGYTKLVGAGSIYTITPCTQEAALKAVEQAQPRPMTPIGLPTVAALPPADPERLTHDEADDYLGDEDEDDDGDPEPEDEPL